MVRLTITNFIMWVRNGFPYFIYSKIPGFESQHSSILSERCVCRRPIRKALEFKATVVNILIRVITFHQCWSESGLVSPAVSPSPPGQSPSPSGVSPSPLDQSPSPSPLDQSPNPSPNPSPVGPIPTKVRVSPDLSPDSAWTHESNNRKVLYCNPTFNHFC